jgi:hypothetical protein
MRILTFLLLMVVGAGQMWAQDEPEPEPVQFGTVMYNGTATNDGGTLKFYKSRKVELDENLITVTNGESDPLTSADWGAIYDENDQIVAYKLFIMATPAVGHRLPAPAADGTVSFIRAEVVTQAQQAPSHRAVPTLQVGQTLPVKFHSYYSGFGGDPATDYYGLYYVVMPADVNLSVSITATFPEAEKNTEAINYVDADGTTQTKAAGEVYVLDGTEARLGYGSYNNRTEHETWYVLPENATYNYTNGLELYGKVHLILADGATMTIGTDSKPVVGNAAIYVLGDLDIYGQSGQSGTLNATTSTYVAIFPTGDLAINGGVINAKSDGYRGIYSEHFLTINGGTVTSTGTDDDGIYASYLITINGGTVTATGAYAGLDCGTGRLSENELISGSDNTGCEIIINGGIVTATGTRFGIRPAGDLIINGGQVTGIGGTGETDGGLYSCNGNIILGWTNPTDFIKASSYLAHNDQTSGMVVKTVEGQRFVAYNMADESDVSASAIASGTVADVTPLAGKTLRPLEGNYVSINTADFDFTGTTSTTSPFTITTGEGENETTTHYYIYKSNDPATLSYTGNDFVQVTGLPEGTTLAAVENQPMKRTFTMPATDVELTATAVTGLTATSVAYDGTARTPEIKQGDDVFDAANYAITYQLDDEAVNAAEVKNVNTYTCTLTGLGQYVGTATVPFDITLRSTNIAVEIVNSETTVDGHPVLIAGDDAHVKVTLVPVKGENETTELPAINGIATLSVSDGINEPKPYTVAIVNGVGHYYVPNFAWDVYAITAEFAGDANHAASTTENATTLEVCMILTETTSSLDKTEINVGEAVKVTVEINEVGLQRPVIDNETHTKKTIMFETKQPLSIDAIVTLKCKTPWDNGEGLSADVNNYRLAIVNGSGIQTFSHLPAGPRTVNAVYAGDDRYCQSISTVENLQVNKTETTIDVEVTSPVIAK